MKGICMKDFLLKQLVAGNKTMTRRTGGLEKVNEDPDKWDYTFVWGTNEYVFFNKTDFLSDEIIQKPRYATGSTVYIKEGYLPGYFDNGGTAYATDWNPTAAELLPKPNFKNKLFMPSSEARYFVRIEDVYPQRLQDITEEDAIQEGVESDNFNFSYFKDYQRKWNLYTYAKDSFSTLIDSINGKGTWDKNPWVWVYKIKMVDNADCSKKDQGYYPKTLPIQSALNTIEDSISHFRTEQLKNRF